MDFRKRILDTDEVLRRRLSKRLSQRRLATKIGVSETLVRNLEQGRNHELLHLGLVVRLAAILEIPLADLFRHTAEETAPQDDDVVVEAALATVRHAVDVAELAGALSWDMKRTNAALAQLQPRLEGSGQQLVNSGWRKVALVPVSFGAREGLAIRQLSSRQRGLTVNTARVLRDLHRIDAEWHRRASNPQRTALAELMNLGIVRDDEDRPGRVELAPEFEYLGRLEPPQQPTWEVGDEDGPSYVAGADTFMSFHR